MAAILEFIVCIQILNLPCWLVFEWKIQKNILTLHILHNTNINTYFIFSFIF